MSVNNVTNSAPRKLPSFSGLGKRAFNCLPHFTIENDKFAKFLKSACDNISSPEQRLIMGVTALFSQPFIDLNNKRVSEDTRLMSFCKTIAKIIVGTAVGVIVRKECIRLASKYTKLDIVEDLDRVLTATKAKSQSFLAPLEPNNYSEHRYKNYTNAIGTILGIGVMMFTNFLIDAPLTQILTNVLYKKLNNEGGKNVDS